ncbi:hypothetical protein ARZXY2_4855 (plasmid) [Arthrobacter sp. ZXY-2]|nr:hypothetical protein ARZXY2_4855 [Arthrobacter sp. ZXY-2]
MGLLVVSGQLPLSPRCFWLLAKLAELFPTEACLPLWQGPENLGRIRAGEDPG